MPASPTIHLDVTSFGFTTITSRGPGAGRSLHLIGRIKPASPAFYSGLREFDQILQINGLDVSLLTHDQVQQVVRESGDRISILSGDKRSIHEITDKGFPISDRSLNYAVQYNSPVPWSTDASVRKVAVKTKTLIRRFSSDLIEIRNTPVMMRKRVSQKVN